VGHFWRAPKEGEQKEKPAKEKTEENAKDPAKNESSDQ
jgi:hypothetical protein